jgi:hypothetical protein
MTMDRNDALEILGLSTDATANEIEHRYAIMVKRLKAGKDRTEMDKVSEAYDFLTGRIVEKEPPDPRDDRVVLGMTVRKWKHFWEYERTKTLFIIGISVAVVSILYTVITNTPPDFSFTTIGDLMISEDTQFQSFISAQMPEVKKAQTDGAYISTAGDGETDTVGFQKAFVLIAAGTLDVVALDGNQFVRYGDQGAYLSLDDFYAGLSATVSADVLAKVVPMKAKVSVENSGDGIEHIYGLDVTALGTYQALGIDGFRVILTISSRAKHIELSETFLTKFLQNTDSLKLLVTPYPTFAPTAAATATPAA